jgi:hypothetical protein
MPATLEPSPAIVEYESAPQPSRARAMGDAGMALALLVEKAYQRWQDNRFRQLVSRGHQLDVAKARMDIEDTAKLEGIDLAAMFEEAGRHFTKSKLIVVDEPLSESELDLLVEDDRMTFDEHGMPGLEG